MTDNAPNGKKFDEDKPQISLLPWPQVVGVVRVLEFGAKKYSIGNWKKVPDGERRYLDAAMRHLGAIMEGEKVDPESGLSHWYHAACCCLFGAWFSEQPATLRTRSTGDGINIETATIRDLVEEPGSGVDEDKRPLDSEPEICSQCTGEVSVISTCGDFIGCKCGKLKRERFIRD